MKVDQIFTRTDVYLSNREAVHLRDALFTFLSSVITTATDQCDFVRRLYLELEKIDFQKLLKDEQERKERLK